MKDSLQPLKILVAEEDEKDFKILSNYLNNISTWKFDIKRLPHNEHLAPELAGNCYDLCFCNTKISYKNSPDILNSSNGNTPVILLSSTKDYQSELLAIKSGAFDFLINEGLDEVILERSINHAIQRINQVEQLKQSEKKFKSLFERLADIIFIADSQYNILNINYALKEILGYEDYSVTGKSLLKFFQQPADAAMFSATVSAEGETKHFEAPMLMANGGVKLCLLSATVETDGMGSDYIQGSIRDLTDLKKAEKANLHSEKHAASGRFIVTLAHELRNPLNNIKLAVENLLPSASSDDDTFFLNIIQRNGERINDLVTELLNSSRPVEIACEALYLHDLLNKVIDNVREQVAQRNISLTTHFDKVDAVIDADRVKLLTALSNIIKNAMEAVKNDTGVIQLTTIYHNNELTLLIKDNGSGISDEQKDQIFEPYFTSKRNGIGLGLSTALNILQSHHAITEVHSTEPGGSTFSIRFSAH